MQAYLFQQSEFMRDLVESQRSMRQELAALRTAARASELRAEMRQPMEKSASGENRAALGAMVARVDAFEQLLRGHTLGQARSSQEEVPAPATPQASAVPAVAGVGPLARSVSAEAVLDDKGTPEKRLQIPDRVEAVVKRMRNKAMLPQQVFLKQLEQYREIPSET